MPLTPPPNAQDHSRGPDDAPVTLVEYGDYQCPYCGEASSIVDAVLESLGGKVRFIFRHFPLRQIHPDAEAAASLAEAAAEKGRFWEMHDLLYENQDRLDVQSLAAYGRRLGLSSAEIRSALDGAYAERIQRDFASGVRSGVNGTPTFFINGIRHDGSWDFDGLTAALQHAMRK